MLRVVTHHLVHSLMLAVPVYGFALAFALEWRRTADAPLPGTLWVAATASLGAAGVHGAVTPHHVHEAALLGWFFALLTLAQAAWAVAVLVAPLRRLVTVGVLTNLGVVTLWAWTRAVGIPFGVGGGVRERVGVLDVTSTLLEVVVVGLGLAWLYARSAPRVPVSRRAVIATPAVR
jgi:hypothetical protein